MSELTICENPIQIEPPAGQSRSGPDSIQIWIKILIKWRRRRARAAPDQILNKFSLKS